ncbi:MAG TPA: putative lipid II flippase FtsW [Candidatus Dormibacteraeota bacterium]|nr:putative lipid II flippase FtsW [Candidatus Dormibacteraeota bacterium]
MSRAVSTRGHRPDYVLAITIFVLLAFGLIMMYNINPALSQKLLGRVDSGYYFRGQLTNVIIGLAVWLAASSIYYRRWRSWAPTLMVVSIIALLALMVPGLSFERNGATRWLGIGSWSFQPAELFKIALVFYLATWFERRGRELTNFWEGVVPFSLMLVFSGILLVVFQRDMGTMMVVALSAIAMFYVAGIKLRHLLVLAGAGLAAGWLAIVTFPHRMSRVAAFLNPSQNTDAGGYHINQALIAIGSGGLFGLGLGKSIQIYGYLPEASNDSIFAVIAEEFGFIGAGLIIALFSILIYRGLKIAAAAPDLFGRLVATGITTVFMFQAFINIAAMIALVPLTGIPLPFISYGGSSLVIMLAGAGILQNISKYTVREVASEDSRKRRRIGRAYIADPGNGRSVKTAR